MRVAVIGLGKLGSPMAAVFASKGHEVYGCDVQYERAEDLANGIAPVEETGLQELLNDCPIPRLLATTEIVEAVNDAEIVFVVVPTPSLPDGSFSAEYVRNVIQRLAELDNSVAYQTIVVVSTLSPGAMDGLLEMFELVSNKACGKDFGLVYNPQFIALGSVIHDLLHPSIILIGEADKKSGDVVAQFYISTIYAQVKRMSFVSAEIAKLGLNVALTQRISYANTISELCENYPGADAADALDAIGSDHRIGQAYMSSGSAYGGPCFPRDCRALIAASSKVGCQSRMAEADEHVNLSQTYRLFEIIQAETRITPNKLVAILGLSYKPDTHIAEESAGISLATRLAHEGFNFLSHDPRAVESQASLGEILASDCSILVVVTPWPQFRYLPLPSDSEVTVIDVWGIVDQERLPTGVRYVRLGVGA